MTKVEVFGTKVELHEFGDVARLIAGTVSIVYCNGDGRFLRIQPVLSDEGSVDRAAHTAAVYQSLGVQGLPSGAGN
ncbi:uncharacterized protein ARMOST_14268 [Armillaria ostoyae]|uniref:Uncharacterized protein n=1 Tax=Armillaria ostoyae TaxID=47428 RepID=A0A284RQ52_ARMOS|nr:uncharacterized protein ARMOST_14268 [Armillaria ostoyae]